MPFIADIFLVLAVLLSFLWLRLHFATIIADVIAGEKDHLRVQLVLVFVAFLAWTFLVSTGAIQISSPILANPFATTGKTLDACSRTLAHTLNGYGAPSPADVWT